MLEEKIEGRVPTVLLRKTGIFSEISTKNLGYLGKKGTHFKSRIHNTSAVRPLHKTFSNVLSILVNIKWIQKSSCAFAKRSQMFLVRQVV
jgi:hypothetical protein